jgi:hypothetical protein
MQDFAYKREFGSLVHEAEAAHDLCKQVSAAVKKLVQKWRTSFWYNVKYSAGISLLEQEVLKLHKGGVFTNAKGVGTKVKGYEEWSAKNLHHSAVLDIEKRMFVDVGPVILAPKLDLVIETHDWFNDGENHNWVVERKTTGRWDDSAWQTRWSLDAQTSIQLLAAETHYDAEFMGLMVEPIQYTRQNRKDAPDPQPIGKAERLPMKWVRKPEQVMVRVMALLEDIAIDLPRRLESNDWPADGMASGACDFCNMKQFCLGNTVQLFPREPDDIDKHNGRKKK